MNTVFENTSNLAQGVDKSFAIILAIIFFFLIGITIMLIYFIYRYNEKRNPVPTQIHGNNRLEIAWTVIPILIVLAMFYYGWIGWKPFYSAPPEDSFKINVSARMWKWNFTYDNGRIMDTMYIPMGRPVEVILESADVIHAFYIPAFRVKQDIIPGKKTVRWFTGNIPGDYDLFCAEYCGLNHSYMYTTVKVLPIKDFDKWYTDTTQAIASGVGTITPAIEGKQLIQRFGCNACHSVDGSKIIGPSYKGIFGHETVVVANGAEKTVMVDEDYIRRSVLDPNIEVVKGFKQGLMQSYKGQVTDKDIDKIIEYIKTLN